MSLRSVSLGLAIASADAANYAVIAVTSSTYYNYRHQADGCHAYQVLRGKGIPAENIVMMMYDDVANDPSNPFLGKLFNKPIGEGEEGYDVRDGCEIDYSGEDVTPDNFIAILTGTASGKKLESTAADNVFVYVVDHGAPGIIMFPNDINYSSEVHKTELQTALQAMSDAKMFKKLVFYLETCYSGSMFVGLDIPNVYAVSAANPHESSWGAYCAADNSVNGKSMNTCLGDLFSVTWMEDSEEQDTTMETLDDQFEAIMTRVHKSRSMQWGDTSFTTSDHVSDFIGPSGAHLQATSEELPVKGGHAQFSNRHFNLASQYARYQMELRSENRLGVGILMYQELQKQLHAEVFYRRLVEIAYPGDIEMQRHLRTVEHPPDNMAFEVTVHQTVREQCTDLFDANSAFAL